MKVDKSNKKKHFPILTETLNVFVFFSHTELSYMAIYGRLSYVISTIKVSSRSLYPWQSYRL